jgi:anti-sigma factor RsiW
MIEHLSDRQLVGYVQGTLTDADREEMDAHLATCPECRAQLVALEALQRRLRNELSADLRSVRPPSSMQFTAITPRLRRRPWRERMGLPAAPAIQAVTAGLALVGLLIALAGVFYRFGWDGERSAATAQLHLPLLAAGFFTMAVMGRVSSDTACRSRASISRLLALFLWAGTAIVGLQAIVVILDVVIWLTDTGLAPSIAFVAMFPLAVGWITVVVGGGEYHYRRVGGRRSWLLFALTVCIELLILAVPYVLAATTSFRPFLG